MGILEWFNKISPFQLKKSSDGPVGNYYYVACRNTHNRPFDESRSTSTKKRDFTSNTKKKEI